MSAKIQPVAWAVYADSFGDDGPAVCKHREVSERLAREVGGRLVPLLATDCAAQAPDFAPQAPDFAPQAPDNGNATLTDAEREAVRFCVQASLPETEKLGGVASELCRMHAATLRGLLERLGGSQCVTK